MAMMARSFRELHRRFGAVLVVVLMLAASASTAQVLVVLSDDSAVYHDVAAELKSRLGALREGTLRIDVATAPAAVPDATTEAHHELIVTVGAAAARDVVTRRDGTGKLAPTLCVLVPRRTFEALPKTGGESTPRAVSAIFIEQPLARQLDLIALALPDARRIGVLFGPESMALAEDLQDLARARGFDIDQVVVGAPADVGKGLQKVLARSDVLLALPDPIAVNASTAYGMLATSYRAQVPVVGFSRAFVDAGSLASVYSTPKQEGRQAAEIAAAVLNGGAPLPPPQYPRYFTVGVNFFAARSLGIMMENEAVLSQALAARSEASPDAGVKGRARQPAAPKTP